MQVSLHNMKDALNDGFSILHAFDTMPVLSLRFRCLLSLSQYLRCGSTVAPRCACVKIAIQGLKDLKKLKENTAVVKFKYGLKYGIIALRLIWIKRRSRKGFLHIRKQLKRRSSNLLDCW